VTLVYVYWEPTDADDIPAFVQHRQEIAHLRAALHDPDVAFESLSYPELWRTWERDDDSPPWLGDHLAGLRARYAVPLSGAA
jgi:hypothetical protein